MYIYGQLKVPLGGAKPYINRCYIGDIVDSLKSFGELLLCDSKE